MTLDPALLPPARHLESLVDHALDAFPLDDARTARITFRLDSGAMLELADVVNLLTIGEARDRHPLAVDVLLRRIGRDALLTGYGYPRVDPDRTYLAKPRAKLLAPTVLVAVTATRDVITYRLIDVELVDTVTVS